MTHHHDGSATPGTIVLVVEDEPVQRMLMADLVRDAGFEPLEAATADHAVAILEKRTDIHIVFTDIEMPGSMDGLRLAACVRRRWPPIQLIVTTAGQPPETADLPPRGIFLPKPLKPWIAIDALRSLMADAKAHDRPY